MMKFQYTNKPTVITLQLSRGAYLAIQIAKFMKKCMPKITTLCSNDFGRDLL